MPRTSNPTSSALTQERLGWRPEGPGLIADIEQGHYFNDGTPIGSVGVEAEGTRHERIVRAR
jgi:hypothetical protein